MVLLIASLSETETPKMCRITEYFLKTFTSSGFNQEQILLPPSPINKAVGGSVLFTIMPFSQPIKAIRWNFNGSNFITYNDAGPEVVNPQYQNRVTLNHTTAELELISLTMADSGKYTLTVTFANGIGIANHTFLEVYGK